MNYFSNGFKDELGKIAARAPLHWSAKAIPVIKKTVTPALVTGGVGSVVGSRIADDPAEGAAKGALIGALIGALPGAYHELLLKRYPELGHRLLEGLPATMTGAGVGAAAGSLIDDENKARGAALGALGGGALLGVPTYMGLANRPPAGWLDAR